MSRNWLRAGSAKMSSGAGMICGCRARCSCACCGCCRSLPRLLPGAAGELTHSSSAQSHSSPPADSSPCTACGDLLVRHHQTGPELHATTLARTNSSQKTSARSCSTNLTDPAGGCHTCCAGSWNLQKSCSQIYLMAMQAIFAPHLITSHFTRLQAS